MCLFRINVPDSSGLGPAKKTDPNTDLAMKPPRKLQDEGDITKIEYGDEADTPSQKKRKGAEDLAIKLQAPEQKTGGIGGIG